MMKKRIFSVFFCVLSLWYITWNNTAFAQTDSEETDCAELALPWAYGAEDTFVAHGSASCPLCWNLINEGDDNDKYYWTSKTGKGAHMGNQCIQFNGKQFVQKRHNDWLITPAINFTGNEQMSFWVTTNSTISSANFHGRLAIYVSNQYATSSTDIANFERIELSGANTVNNRFDFYGKTWQQISFALPSHVSGSRYVAFVVDTNSYTFLLDDIYIYSPSSCAMPTDVHTTALTSNAIEIAWNSTATSYTVYCDTVGVGLAESYSVVASDNSIEITDLLPNTVYNISVEAACDDGVLSVPTYPISVKTACAPFPIEDMPFIENFSDNEVGVNAPLDDCWYKGNNIPSSSYPFIKSSFSDTSLTFSSTTAMYSYAVLPEMEEDVSNLILSCRIHGTANTNSHANLLLGLIRNPNDISTMTVYDTLIPTVAGEWNEFIIPLYEYNMDDGSYLVFKMDKGGTGEAYLDNIKLEVNTTSCDAPTSVRLVTVSANSADIEWSDAYGAAWRVYYDEVAEDSIEARYIDVATTSATITGLTPQTEYQFWVVTDCQNGEYSMATPKLSFTTACGAISTLPYIEDFESYEDGAEAIINPCWYAVCSDPSEPYPYPSILAAIHGNRGLWLQAFETTQKQYHSYVALPSFTEPINSLRVRFKMKNYMETSHSSEHFSKIAVGVMSLPNDISTFDTVQIFDMTALPNGTVQSSEVAFSNYNGAGSYIAFLALDVDNGESHFAENIAFLDDIEVSLIPSCATPTNIVATGVSGSSIDLSWSGSATNYKVMYSTHPDMSDSTIVTATSNAIQLTNLASYTYYYIKLASVCGAGELSEWSYIPFKVRTEMNCGEGFVNYVDTIGDGTLANRFCVINGNNTSRNTRTWSIYTAQELVDMGLTGEINWIKAISLHTKIANEPLPVRIYMAHTTTDAFTSNCADTIALSQMTLVYDHTYAFTPNSWNELVLDTPFNYDGTSNLMIAYERVDVISDFTEFYYSTVSAKRTAYLHTQNASTYPPMAVSNRGNIVFNICGGNASCARPSHVVVADVSSSSISLAWQGSASNYQVVYASENFNPDNLTNQTSLNITSNSTTISGLTPQTTYYFYIRSVCDDEYSEWSICTTIATPCDAINELPYVENFDSYVGGYSASSGQIINACWVKGTNNGTASYPFVYKSKSFSAPNSLSFRGASYGYCYVALPAFTESLTNLTLAFKMMNTDDTKRGPLYIGVMSNQHDIATFEVVDSVENTIENEWQDFEVVLNHYQGSGQYIALKMEQQSSGFIEAYVDNLEVYLTPSCMAPSNIAISSIAAYSATLTWTNNNVASPSNGYQLQYGPSGFVLGEGAIVSATSNVATLSNLNASSTYDVYVRSICGEGDTSRWSSVATFSTNCVPFALPIFYDFEDWESGIDAELSNCVYRFNDATSSSVYSTNVPYVAKSSFVSHSHSGDNYLYFKMNSGASSAQTAAMIFPMVDTLSYPMSSNQISFWAKAQTVGNLVVGIVNDPFDISTFVAIDTLYLNNQYARYTVTFSSFQGFGGYPTLLMHQEAENRFVYVDDVLIESVPPCAIASNLHAISTTHNTAEVAWTDTIGSTQWVLEYYVEGSDVAQTINVTSNPYTITGLTPLTKYFFNIRTICSSGAITNPSIIPGEFITSQTPASLPYHYDFDEASEWANWQTSSNASANWYRGSFVTAQGGNALYISNDAGATRGSNWNTRVNAVAYRDIDFGVDTSSFVMTFRANVGGILDDDIAIAVMRVNPTDEVIASNDKLTTPWGPADSLALLTIRQDSVWGTYRVHFDSIAGVQRIAFYWYNPNLGLSNTQSDSAGAIDDIHIFEPTCVRPTHLHTTQLDVTSATLNWNGEASTYEVTYNSMVYGNEITDSYTEIVQGNSLSITNLMPNTNYSFWLRAICSDGDTSDRSNVAYFTTLCDRYVASDTLREDFSTVVGGAHNLPGELPNCWDAYSNGFNNITPHVVDSGWYYYTHNDKALIMTAGTASKFGTQAVVRLPYTVEPVNTLSLRYWLGTQKSTLGVLEVGYLTDTNMATDFVAVDSIYATYYTWCRNNGNQPQGSGIYDTVSFANVPADAQAIAFRWCYTGSGIISACIDDVELIAHMPCRAPQIQDITVDYESATISWIGSASNYQLCYKSTIDDRWSDTLTTSATSYTFTNLLPETTYQLMLRSMCGDDEASEWFDTLFTTDLAPCYIPSLITVSDILFEEATIDWQTEGDIAQWVVRTYTTVDTLIDTTTIHPITISGLYSGTSYQVDVQSVCSNDRFSERSAIATFTTQSCPSPTNVLATDISNHSAILSWHDDGASWWEIKYGVDIDQDSGHDIETSENTCTLTNLTEATCYDVYVRSYCAESIFSNWSDKYTFTTLSSHEGIDGVEGPFQLAIYPNPTSGIITISLNGVEGKVSITLIDMNGRIITSDSIECGADCTKRMDVTSLSHGTYFIRVLGSNINSVRKLIVR